MNLDGRIHFLDAARAILMCLGIPFHVAAMYTVGSEWVFATSDVKSATLTLFADFIRVFRMPLFFIVAGYFSMMSLSKSSPGKWFGGRVVKLGVPLLVVGVLLNPISILAQPDAARLLAEPGEHWVAHLWFLPTLVCLCAVLALMQQTPLQTWFRRSVDWLAARPMVGAAVFVVVAAGLGGAGSLLGRRLPDVFLVRELLSSAVGFLPFMMLGVAMRMNRQLLTSMCSSSVAAFVATLVPLGFVLSVGWGGFGVNVLRIVCSCVVCLGLARALLTFCRLTLDNPSRRVRNIADASFTMYLVHMPLLNVFYVFVRRAGLPVFLEFALMVVLVSVASYAVHRLIVRSAVLMFLFNGKPIGSAQPPQPLS